MCDRSNRVGVAPDADEPERWHLIRISRRGRAPKGGVARRLRLGLMAVFVLLPKFAFSAVTAADLTWSFECGSLGSAATVQPNELNLTLRLDDLNGDLYGWYNFKITQHAAGQLVTFHVLNPDNWYTANHQPVYSQDGGQTWGRISDCWMANDDFHFRQQFTADSAWIALVFPYGYSRLIGELAILDASPYFEYEYIGLTVHQREIPLVTITDPTVPASEKRTAWLMSRQHPMETAASFLLESLMEFLVDPNQPAAERMRRTTIYRIVPMVNIDGVVEGLSRHNANGINLNRCWAYDSLYQDEQPEVNACHVALDEWIYSGHDIGLFNDFHCAPDLYDFGYKLSATYASPAYNQDLTSFTRHLDEWDSYQDWTLWREMESSYGTGLVTMALYQQHGLLASSSENSWSRRGNGQYLTIGSLEGEGIFWALAMDDYLHQVRITEASGNIIEIVLPGDMIYFQVKDPDENVLPYVAESLPVVVRSQETADQETFVLTETGLSTGVFFYTNGALVQTGIAQPGDGVLDVSPPDRLYAIYVDDEFPLDSSWALAEVDLPDTTVSISLVPDDPPVVIHSSGGSFSYQVSVSNSGTQSAMFDAWITVRLPDGSWFGPLLGPINLTLMGSVTLNRNRVQNVPGLAPAGVYHYSGRIGIYPDQLWAEDHFAFAKEGVAGHWSLAAGDWGNEGESLLSGWGGERTPALQQESMRLTIHPNPFNNSTMLTFTLPQAGWVRVEVFDIEGSQVSSAGFGKSHKDLTTDLQWLETGTHEMIFAGSDLPSGVYFGRLQMGGRSVIEKMVLIK